MNMASVTDGTSTIGIGRGSQRRGKTMRVSDFVSSSFDRFDQQYNTACSRANMTSNGPSSSASSSSTNNGANHVLSTAEDQSMGTGRSRRNAHTNSDGAAEDLVPISFAHSVLFDLLRRSNNDLQNYGGNTSLPLLLIALARVVVALLSLLLSVVGIVFHLLLAVTIRILFAVLYGVSFVQRVLWRIVERVITRVAIRMHWQHMNRSSSSCNYQENKRNGHTHSSSDNCHDTDNHGEERRGGGGRRIFLILESYRKHILQQLPSLITPSATTRNKLDTLPDIMNNTPPSLSLFALVTALAFIVHPDGLTWIVLGKLCEGVWLGFKLLRAAATAIVAALLSTSIEDESGERISSIGSETLSTIVASAVLASLIMLGKVMYRALYKKNTVTDAQATSNSSSKKKKGRRGRNSGRHGNHHNRSGHRNNRKDATTTTSDSSSRTDSSSLPTHHHSEQKQQHQPLRSRSRSLSPCTTRTDSSTSFVEEKETGTKSKVGGCGNDEATSKESKENDKMESDSLTDSSNSANGKPSSVQQLPHDPARDILSKLRPDSTDSLSVPQLSDEDVSLGSSVAGSLVVDCAPKQGGGTNRGGNSGSSNKTTKKRGGARGKYNGGGHASTNNGVVRIPPGFVSKDSSSSSTKSTFLSRHTAANSKAYSGKNSSPYERNDDRKQKQYPKKKSRDMNHQQRGTRMRASTSDCVIREHEVHSSPLLSGRNGTVPADKMASPSASSMRSSGQHQLQPAQRVRVSSTNELTSPSRLNNQMPQEPSLLSNGAMIGNTINSPISPPVIRPPPGLGFGNPVEMNSVGNGGVGGVELAPANNHAVPGPTLSLSSPGRHQSQTQVRQYSSFDQSNFLLQPSVFPSMSNHHKLKEAETSEDDRIDADLQQLGDQMVGSVLDF